MNRHITVTLPRHFLDAYKISPGAAAAGERVWRGMRPGEVEMRESRCIKQFGARLVSAPVAPHKTLWTRVAVG